MKLLVINPNISTDVSGLIRAEAERSAAADTEISVATAAYGVEYIETRMESVIAAGAVSELVAEQHGSYDGVVVAAFGDPGLPALKELVDQPVVGITEAAMCAAAMLGQRFSIIAISQRIRPWYQDAVDRFGFTGRLASLRCLSDRLGGIGHVQEDFREPLLELSLRAVREDGADAVILAGAPLAGLGRSLGAQIPVPVVDGIGAGVRMCEALVGLRAGSHQEGAFAIPPQKPRRGLSPALTDLLDTRQHQHQSPSPDATPNERV